jgi:hypothetical protein
MRAFWAASSEGCSRLLPCGAVFVAEHLVWTAGIQADFDETCVARHAARRVIIEFDQRNELADVFCA